MALDYKLIRSNRKTITLQIKHGQLIVRVGNRVPQWYISNLIEQKSAWIESKLTSQKNSKPRLTYSKEQLDTFKLQATLTIPPKVDLYAHKIGVIFNRISFRNQKTLWGSCSSKGNLNFNIQLVNTPEHVLDYVIIHELCHLIEHNHSSRFWNLVKQFCPEFKQSVKWLKEHGRKILS